LQSRSADGVLDVCFVLLFIEPDNSIVGCYSLEYLSLGFSVVFFLVVFLPSVDWSSRGGFPPDRPWVDRRSLDFPSPDRPCVDRSSGGGFSLDFPSPGFSLVGGRRRFEQFQPKEGQEIVDARWL
jgi:hypothetical protein